MLEEINKINTRISEIDESIHKLTQSDFTIPAGSILEYGVLEKIVKMLCSQ